MIINTNMLGCESVEITVLIENISEDEALIAEHGLALHINNGDKKYLLDTGQTGAFIDNAEKLGIDLRSLDYVIISHNHYDHIGGLERLFSYNKEVKAVIKSQAKHKYYTITETTQKYIGEKDGLFEDYKDRFIFIDEPMKLDENIKLMFNEVVDMKYFCKDTRLCVLDENKFIQDDFKHELFLVVDIKDELSIISSCSHNGIVNIVKTVQNAYGNRNINQIIAGLHMKGQGDLYTLNCSEEYVKDVAMKIMDTKVQEIHTGHCTGTKAYALMKNVLGDKLRYMFVGKKIKI